MTKRGFTLIELLVVVAIVTVAFISIIGLVHQAITLYYNNKNALVANNLAQEGLELVRFIRNDNWLIPPTYQGSDYYFARNLSVDGDNKQKDGNKFIFAIDPRVLTDDSNNRASIMPFFDKYTDQAKCAGAIKDCLKDRLAKLYRDETDANNIINVAGITQATDKQFDTGFSRLIMTEYRDGGDTATTTDDYLHVESWVYYQDHGRDKYFHLDTDLYDYAWKK